MRLTIGSSPNLRATATRYFQPGRSFHGSEMRAEGADAPGDEAQRGVRDALGHALDALPGILAQLAHRFLDVRAREQLDRQKAGRIEALGDRQHHAGRHPLGPETLVAVADGGVDE